MWDVATTRRELLLATLHRRVSNTMEQDDDAGDATAVSFPDLVLRTRVDNALGAVSRATEHAATHSHGQARLKSTREWVKGHRGGSPDELLSISFAINACTIRARLKEADRGAAVDATDPRTLVPLLGALATYVHPPPLVLDPTLDPLMCKLEVSHVCDSNTPSRHGVDLLSL